MTALDLQDTLMEEVKEILKDIITEDVSKSMGQNFLIEDWVPREIAKASGAHGDVGAHPPHTV